MNQTENTDLHDIENSVNHHEEDPVNAIEVSSSDETHHSEKDSVVIAPAIASLLQEIDQLTHLEAKLQKSIEFMEGVLSQGKTPNFKHFWQARDISLKLFKEHISPSARATLWNKYSELSKEARRLKELLDEQSSFASEQIDLAIQALEAEITRIKEDDSLPPQLAITSKAIEKNYAFYAKTQHILDLLNTQASRINALRKELIRTEMRVKKKNQFFQRLSAAGDKVFPQRKALIQELSKQFLTDIDQFVTTHFSKETPDAPCYFLRDEIKALQSIAKVLTLNSQAFVQSRSRLSECWDKVKEFDKERKKERSQQKTIFKQNLDEILKQIEGVAQEMEESKLSSAEAQQRLNQISKHMRDVELGREEVSLLREKLEAIRKPILDKVKQEEQQREEVENERVRQKLKRHTDLKEEVQALIQRAPSLDPEGIIELRDALNAKIQASTLTKGEKQEAERLLKTLRDLIVEKKEQALLSLPEGDRQQLQQLRELLGQRKERRQEIKNQIEVLRKAKGSSGLDFEKAMEFSTQLNDEKERLDKINIGIDEIEEKIAHLEA